MRLSIKYDLRRAPFSPATHEELYAACLEQCAWADAAGFDRVGLPQHHGADDGYCPATSVLGAAIAARTGSMVIDLKAVLLPLYDPIRLAEELAVLDLISNGRLEVLFGAGYRPAEFEMFRVPFSERGRRMTDHIPVLRQAWTGEPFKYHGSTVQVRPRPARPGGPRIVLGGSTEHAARRAARLADGYDPVPPAAHTFEVYREECARLGRTPSEPRRPHPAAVFLMVAEDPEAVWAEVAPYALHEANSYGQWNLDAGLVTHYQVTSDPDELRTTGQYRVVTPDECLGLAQQLGPTGQLILHPLMGGLPVDLSWRSLELFKTAVLPQLEALGWRPDAESAESPLTSQPIGARS